MFDFKCKHCSFHFRHVRAQISGTAGSTKLLFSPSDAELINEALASVSGGGGGASPPGNSSDGSSRFALPPKYIQGESLLLKGSTPSSDDDDDGMSYSYSPTMVTGPNSDMTLSTS